MCSVSQLFFWAVQGAMKLTIMNISPIRPTALHVDSCPAFERPFQNCSSIEKTVKKTEDLLEDLGQLREQMHNIVQVKYIVLECPRVCIRGIKIDEKNLQD